MGIDLSSSEVCFGVQLGKAFVVITSMCCHLSRLPQSAPPWGWEKLALSPPVLIFLVQIIAVLISLGQSQAPSVLSSPRVETPQTLVACFQSTLAFPGISPDLF